VKQVACLTLNRQRYRTENTLLNFEKAVVTFIWRDPEHGKKGLTGF
jgi:hypothetical protein